MSIPRLVDIGGNLTNKAFRDDVGPVLDRAAHAGVSAIVVTGVSTTASRRAWEIAKDHTAPASTDGARAGAVRLFATAGIHPHHASSASRRGTRRDRRAPREGPRRRGR